MEENKNISINMELTEEQLSLIILCLETVARFQMKQGDLVSDLLCICPDKSKFDSKEEWDKAFNNYLSTREFAGNRIKALADAIYGPGYHKQKDTDRILDIWRTFRHLQYELLPEENKHPYADIRADVPFPISDYPAVKITLKKFGREFPAIQLPGSSPKRNNKSTR